jgi:hypothetical protein
MLPIPITNDYIIIFTVINEIGDWGITFNATKTKSMLFSRKKMANLPPLFFNKTMLENSKSYKHLSVTFNSNGKWNNHINKIYTKACRRIK